LSGGKIGGVNAIENRRLPGVSSIPDQQIVDTKIARL
jgi:hypothetical protein